MKNERTHLLVFGYGLSVILAFFCVHLGIKHGWGILSIILFVCAVGFAVVTKIDVYKIKPFYKKWMKVAHAIGTVITAIILSILFYGIFGIVGIVLRILNKDLLDRKIKPSKKSYWQKREEIEFDPKHYLRQF